MPRKRNKGKKSKKKNTVKNGAAAEEESIEVLLAELEIEDDLSLKTDDTRDILDTHQCAHGFVHSPNALECRDFIEINFTAFAAMAMAGGDNILEAMETVESSEVWSNLAKLTWCLSELIATATNVVLHEKCANTIVFVASFFEQRVAALESPENFLQAPSKMHEVLEIIMADEHTVVSYLMKRIPCKCLDEKYQQVKNLTKMGRCCNDNCPLPDRTTERGKMMTCSQCRAIHYCSRECQKSDWKKHKAYCSQWSRELRN